ncbi:MAG: acyltransferase [Lachnospiraceae bacterium]|nr:acyltransferase [Lachnospiraceae bacterium]
MSEKKTRNSSIDIFRLCCAIMIIMGHTYFLKDISPIAGFWAARFLPRICVPFFLCTTGYFYIHGLKNGKNTFVKQIKYILKAYIAWTVIYYSLSLVLAIKNNESMGNFFKERFVNFFFEGSYYHLWYFPALIYPFILAALCYKIGKMKGIKVLAYTSIIIYVIFFIGTDYINLGQYIPLINNLYKVNKYEVIRGILGMGLPFFMMGYFVNVTEDWYKKITPSQSTVLFLFWFGGYIIETICAFLTTPLDSAAEEICVAIMLLPTLFFFFVFLLKHPYPQYGKYTGYCKRMSNYIYFVHPIFIAIIELGASIIGKHISNTPLFFIITIISLISGTIFYKLDNKYTRLLV